MEPGQSRMYLVQPDRPIDFTVAHAHRMPTPFRVDVRHLRHLSAAPAPEVIYEWLTAQGDVAKTGRLTSAAARSLYDRIPSLSPDVSVSDPSTSFFAIPTHFTRLRFRLPSPPPAAPVIIAAWNRPTDLVRELFIGHEREPSPRREVATDVQRQWAWFPKRPDNVKHLVAEQRSYLLHVQPRPPQPTDGLQGIDYQVEQYRPEGLWRGRYLFVPRAPEAPLRAQALAATYHPLPTARERRLTLSGLPQLRFLQPTLLYFSDTAKPHQFEVMFNGIRHHQGTTTGRQGEITLPAVSKGTHRIRVQSQPGTRWYMNHVASGSPSHLKRLAYRLDATGLSFIYERQRVTEETLSMRWYAPHDNRQATYLHVHLALSPPSRRTPSPSWTFHGRRYALAPNPSPPIPVLNTDVAHVDGGQPFFLPIGQDVPAGRYRIRLRLEQGPPGYITLAKLNRGVFENRQFTGEKVPQYAQMQP